MASVNLLPENLRGREAKEKQRIARRAKTAELEFSRVSREKNVDLQTSGNKLSWWQKIFGQPNKKVMPVVKPQFPATAKTMKDNWLNTKRRQKTVEKIPAFSRPTLLPPKPVENKLVENHPAPLPPPPPIKSSAKFEPAIAAFGFFKWKKPAQPPKILKTAPPQLKKLVLSADSPAPLPRFPAVSLPAAAKDAIIKKIKPMPIKKFSNPLKWKKNGVGINFLGDNESVGKYLSGFWQMIIIVIVAGLSAIAVYGAYEIVNLQQSQLDSEIAAKQRELDNLKKEIFGGQEEQTKNFLYQKKLANIQKLLKSHVYWSSFFRMLEKYTLDQVYYDSLTIDTTGEFVLPAVAADYDIMAQQIAALQQATDFVKQIQVDGIKLYSTEKGGVAGVSFNLKLALQDKVLNQP